MPGTIPSNTALIILLCEAYNPEFRRPYDATTNIIGSGRQNIKTIIWATYESTLQFSSEFFNKQIFYSGFDESDVNEVSQNEFGKDADVIYSSFTSPVNISIIYDGKNYFLSVMLRKL